MYGKIAKPFWDDRPVAVIGGGPSLVDFDFERLRGAHVLAIKDSIFDIPWADAGLDYDGCRDKLANVQSRIYLAVRDDETVEPSPSKNITLLKRRDERSLSDDPGVIHDGGTTADFGALQVCVHKRAKQIVLFGFDYSEARWSALAGRFAVYAPYFNDNGIRVFNASPASGIACFQRVTLGDGVTVCSKGGL